MTEEYITQVSEEIEGRVFKKQSQEFYRTESRFSSALSKLDEFLLNPQVRTCSGTVRGTSRNSDLENWEPTRDRSQNDPYPKVEFSTRRTSNSANSDQEKTSENALLLYCKISKNYSCNLAQLQKVVHTAHFPACALIILDMK